MPFWPTAFNKFFHNTPLLISYYICAKLIIMIKTYTTLLIALGIYSATFAQTKNTAEFGVNIGYNAATVKTDQYSNSSNRNGFNLGASAEYYFSERWSIKGKLIYDQKGWNDGFITSDNTDYTTNYELDYITVPVMANWHFGRKRNWYLHFGPYVGILLNARETAFNTDLKSTFNGTDVGFSSGVGVKFPISNNAKLFVEADGQDGFTDIFQSNSDAAVFNERFSINIGINFSLR
jgi:hypothetical protein